MPLTICDNMVPFMFPYLKRFGIQTDSSTHTYIHTRSRTFTEIIVRLQGPPYLSGHYISSPGAISDSFRHKWWKNSILLRFRGLFCRIVYCCNLLGSGIISKNVEILTFKILTNDQIQMWHVGLILSVAFIFGLKWKVRPFLEMAFRACSAGWISFLIGGRF